MRIQSLNVGVGGGCVHVTEIKDKNKKNTFHLSANICGSLRLCVWHLVVAATVKARAVEAK